MHEYSDRDGSNPPTERELHAYLAGPVDPDATVTALPVCCRDKAAENAGIDALRTRLRDAQLRENAHLERIAQLRARVKSLKDACETLGMIVHDQSEMALDASGRRDLIDETGDGDWELVWGELAELRPRLEAVQTRAETNDRILQNLIDLANASEHPIPPEAIRHTIYGAPGAHP